MTTVELARLLARVAGDLEHRRYPAAGIVRQAAVALLDTPTPTEEGCQGCGVALTQPATGRPKRWCSERCRRPRRR